MDVILVPGFWLDGSSWADVLPPITAAGHHAHPLTLPGMHADAVDRAAITLWDHVESVVATIDALPDAPVALVGHSGGAAAVHGAVDARPERVARAVYVDAWPTADGDPVNAELPELDGAVPLPDWTDFDAEDLVDLDDGLRAAFRERAIPTPVRVTRDPTRLVDPRRLDVPVTVVACEFPAAAVQKWMAAEGSPLRELAAIHDVTWVDLPTGHWPQLTRPRELGEVIAAALSAS